MRDQALDATGDWSAAGKEHCTSYCQIGSRQPVEECTEFLGRMPMRAAIGTGASGATLLQIQQAVPIQQTDGEALPCDAKDLAYGATGVVDKAKGRN